MIGLLRADSIRLRRRYDVWIVGLAVPLLAAFGFIRGYFDIPSHYGFDTSQPTPPEVLLQMATEQSHFGFPYSVVMMSVAEKSPPMWPAPAKCTSARSWSRICRAVSARNAMTSERGASGAGFVTGRRVMCSGLSAT